MRMLVTFRKDGKCGDATLKKPAVATGKSNNPSRWTRAVGVSRRSLGQEEPALVTTPNSPRQAQNAVESIEHSLEDGQVNESFQAISSKKASIRVLSCSVSEEE